MTDHEGNDDDTIRSIVRGVYAAGTIPLGRSVRRRWGSARRHPGRLLTALAATVVAVPAAILYVVLATAVPVTVVILMAITWPITAVALLQRARTASGLDRG